MYPTITIDAQGWIKEAVGIYYPNRSWGPFTQKPREIVIHGTATPGATAQAIATGWGNVDGDASAHVLINKDGTFVQGLSLNWTAWGNCCLTDNPNNGLTWDRRLPVGNQNQWSIALEHCKDDALYNSDVLTPAQQATSFALVRAICEYHSIPTAVIGYDDITNGGIIGHCNIDALNRTYCPGPYPWEALHTSLKGTPMIPTGWKDDGATLTAPNGHVFVRGFRQAALDAFANGENPDWWLPAENERSVSQVELHTDSGPGSRQCITKGLLIWTTALGVRQSAAGLEIFKAYADLAAQAKQIAALEAQITALQQPPVVSAIDVQGAIAALGAITKDAAALKTALRVQ